MQYSYCNVSSTIIPLETGAETAVQGTDWEGNLYIKPWCQPIALREQTTPKINSSLTEVKSSYASTPHNVLK